MITAILWAASSDRLQERRWHAAIRLVVAALGVIWAVSTTDPILATRRPHARDGRDRVHAWGVLVTGSFFAGNAALAIVLLLGAAITTGRA